MIIGRYPASMGPQMVADTFTMLIYEHYMKGSSKTNRDRERGPYSKGDNHWQLDTSNDYWLRVNESEKKYTLSCRYDRSQTKTLEAISAAFEKMYPSVAVKKK